MMKRFPALAALLAVTPLLFAQASPQSQITAAQQKEALAHQPAPAGQPARINGYAPKWWKEAVVYQVYPRSFQDTNGDGIGDLNGITEHLDYLQKLGVDVIWLSPHFDSPNADNGYDIRDYRKVMAEFGTMADFDRMLAGLKQRHMRLIIDLVANHTSDEHRWFVESRKSKTNPYRDFYIWRPGHPDPSYPAANGAPAGLAPPNNYPSFFSGSAWQYNPPTQDFYLHLFAVKQPDLNWDNPKVRQEVYSLMRFWLDKGVDGFRMDVIPLISKQPGLPNLTPEQLKTGSYVQLAPNGPHRDEYLQEMNREVLAKYDDMSVGEALGITLEEEPLVVGANRHELNMIFNFDAVRLNREGRLVKPYTLPDLKAIYTRHAEVLGREDWDTVFLSNHDNPRVVSNFGDDRPQFRVASAKCLETMVLTLRGTAFLFQGDELGMTNFPFTSIGQYNDIEAHNAYKDLVETRHTVSEADYLGNLAKMSRDNSRTPMQWSAAANGGFTTAAAHPWLAVNPNFATINAEAEQKDPNSVLRYMQELLALRASSPAWVYGDYKDLAPQDPHIFAYTRALPAGASTHTPATTFLVVLNMSSAPQTWTLPAGLHAGSLALANLSRTEETGKGVDDAVLHLRPWEARIYQQPQP